MTSLGWRAGTDGNSYKFLIHPLYTRLPERAGFMNEKFHVGLNLFFRYADHII